MLLGLETFSYHLAFAYREMDIFAFIKRTHEFGLDGVQINIEGDDLGHLGSDDSGFLRDVRAMADPDPSVIEEEIKTKIPRAKKGGGYIYHSDHSVPTNVSFEQYRRVLELAREYGAY